ncbi:MAG: hypothetical protein CMP81_25620 [Fulvimarina sp.]|nr:hypothetical protein [Fulvimarina sp.]
MPNFFFDLRVGDRFIVDDKGTECETAEKAREEALHSMVEVASSYMVKGRQSAIVTQVRRDDGTVIFQARLALEIEGMTVG